MNKDWCLGGVVGLVVIGLVILNARVGPLVVTKKAPAPKVAKAPVPMPPAQPWEAPPLTDEVRGSRGKAITYKSGDHWCCDVLIQTGQRNVGWCYEGQGKDPVEAKLAAYRIARDVVSQLERELPAKYTGGTK